MSTKYFQQVPGIENLDLYVTSNRRASYYPPSVSDTQDYINTEVINLASKERGYMINQLAAEGYAIGSTSNRIDFVAFYSGTKVYENGSLQLSLNSGDNGGFAANGNIITWNKPVSYFTSAEDYPFMYNLRGTAFSQWIDRSNALTDIMAWEDNTTVVFETSGGISTGILNQYDTTGATQLTEGVHLIYSDKPVSVRNKDGNTTDDFHLHPCSDLFFGIPSDGEIQPFTSGTATLVSRSDDGTLDSTHSLTRFQHDGIDGDSNSLGPAVVVYSTKGDLFFYNSQADGDGSEAVPHESPMSMGTVFSLPDGASHLAISSYKPANIVISNTGVVTTLTLTNSVSDPIYYGYTTSNIEQGAVVTSDYPVAAIIDDSDAGEESYLQKSLLNRSPYMEQGVYFDNTGLMQYGTSDFTLATEIDMHDNQIFITGSIITKRSYDQSGTLNSVGYGLYVDSGNYPTFYARDTAGNVLEAKSSEALATGNKYHIMGVRESNQITLYINTTGTTAAGTLSDVTNDGEVTVGSWRVLRGNYIHYLFPDVIQAQAFSTAFTSGQVASHYNLRSYR